jgi:hypothetical protein
MPQMKNIVINGLLATNSYAHATSAFTGYSAMHPLDVYLAYTSARQRRSVGQPMRRHQALTE